ncbi:DUF4421 family protein [Flavobacterium silvaticum]|uniref:DUF4421 domain-containing protein n=1 Tax=Flavobacterium silvaticum TaxID=1852020 RepID=A0A972FMC7_9FLAO|nr:DUF4421 family protein [Flavobacterium silvaticum]NMH28322.1 DUF4421 domain-containing protein [Flavobacterium silvaticum]
MARKYAYLLSILPGFVNAQEDSTTVKYFETYDQKVSLELFLLRKENTFTLDYRDEDIQLEMRPNSRTTLNLGASYDVIAFSFGYAPNFLEENKAVKDPSKMYSFELKLFPKRLMQHFEFYYQKGMTLEVMDTHASTYVGGMKTLKIGGSTSYRFNPNYSFKAMAMQNERQIKSAGTFAPGISYYYTELDGNGDADIDGKFYFVDIAFFPAYYYNWVIARHVQVMGGIATGAGLTFSHDEGTSTTALLVQGQLLLGLGYNSDSWFGGLNARVQVSSHNSGEGVDVGDALGYFTLFGGYRFDAPEFLKSRMQKAKELLQKKEDPGKNKK